MERLEELRATYETKLDEANAQQHAIARQCQAEIDAKTDEVEALKREVE
jgi:hypothetical protein